MNFSFEDETRKIDRFLREMKEMAGRSISISVYPNGISIYGFVKNGTPCSISFDESDAHLVKQNIVGGLSTLRTPNFRDYEKKAFKIEKVLEDYPYAIFLHSFPEGRHQDPYFRTYCEKVSMKPMEDIPEELCESCRLESAKNRTEEFEIFEIKTDNKPVPNYDAAIAAIKEVPTTGVDEAFSKRWK